METPNNNLKIFIVDDDMFSLNLYRQHIENLGYTDITVFSDGSDCLTQLTENPNVIFLDYNMYTLNGFEVLKKIKRYNPNIYVIMCSAQENMKTAVDALKYGAFDYLIKGDKETEKMENVLNRIIEIQEVLAQTKPSFFKKFLSFI